MFGDRNIKRKRKKKKKREIEAGGHGRNSRHSSPRLLFLLVSLPFSHPSHKPIRNTLLISSSISSHTQHTDTQELPPTHPSQSSRRTSSASLPNSHPSSTKTCYKTKCSLITIPSAVSDVHSSAPPGGWSSLHNLAICCPDLLHNVYVYEGGVGCLLKGVSCGGGMRRQRVRRGIRNEIFKKIRSNKGGKSELVRTQLTH